MERKQPYIDYPLQRTRFDIPVGDLLDLEADDREPARIRGGSIATWSYANRSDVTFVDDKLHSWTEPR